MTLMAFVPGDGGALGETIKLCASTRHRDVRCCRKSPRTETEGAMAAYLVVEVTGVSDEAGLGRYIEQVGDLVARHGGRYLARGPSPRSWRASTGRCYWESWSFPTWRRSARSTTTPSTPHSRRCVKTAAPAISSLSRASSVAPRYQARTPATSRSGVGRAPAHRAATVRVVPSLQWSTGHSLLQEPYLVPLADGTVTAVDPRRLACSALSRLKAAAA